MKLIDADALKENAFEVNTKEYGRVEVVGVDAIDEAPAAAHGGKRKSKWFLQVALLIIVCVVITGAEFSITGEFDGSFIGYIIGSVTGFALGIHNKRGETDAK